METLNIFWRNVKWRFQNPTVIMMTLTQPIIWLLLFSTLFGQNVSNQNPDSYTAFALPGILVMTVLTSAGMSGISNYYLKSCGVFYRLYRAPVKRSSIVMGFILDVVVLSFIEIFVLLVLSFLLSVRIRTGIFGFLLMLLLLCLTIFFVAGLSYSLSFAFQDENPFIAVLNTFMLPLFFVSTALIPYEQIPTGFQIPVLINPFTYLINSLRNLILDPVIAWYQVLFSAGLMAILSVLSFCLAIHCLKNESKQ